MSRIPLPLAKVLDEMAMTSTYPLSEHRPLLGEECMEIVGLIRRQELGIMTPGIQRNMLETLITENSQLRLARALADKSRDEALQLCGNAITAGEKAAVALEKAEQETQLARLAYSDERNSHLATQRALVQCWANNPLVWSNYAKVIDSARAAVAQADSCKKNDHVFLTNSEPRACKCTMAQRVVGDGCDVCNPELAAEIERDNRADAQEGGAL